MLELVNTASTGAPTSCGQTGVATAALLDFQYDFALGTADNGNVTRTTNRRTPGRSITYQYDALNRIKSAITDATSGTFCWGQLFGSMSGSTYVSGYDAWSNLTTITPDPSRPGCTTAALSKTINAYNKIIDSGYGYDNAGNMTAQPGLASTFNAENQMTSAAGVTYTYDGDGKRVKKSNGKLYWYGLGSDALSESDFNGTVSDAYIFFNGKRIARQATPNNGVPFFYFSDHLGTKRAIAQNGASSACYDADYYPFGSEAVVATNTCPQNYKFTGKERDTESNLDNFGARFDSSSLARFTSPDPKIISLKRAVDPQQWNGYAYVRNNPLMHVDPDGHELHLVIYNSSGIDKQLATRVAIEITSKYRQAGVKNVSFEIKQGEPGLLTGLRYAFGPTPHSHLLEIRKNGDGTPAISDRRGGQNWDFGGHSAIDASAVKRKGPKSDDDLVMGLANAGAHEAAHDLFPHQGDDNDIMNGEGEAGAKWLFDPNHRFSQGEAEALQKKYNKPGEIELTPPPPPPPEPPPCADVKDHPCPLT